MEQGGEGEAGGVYAVVKAAVACGHLLQHRHREKQMLLLQEQQRLEVTPSPVLSKDGETCHVQFVAHDVSQLMSEMLDTVCADLQAVTYFTMREMVAGEDGLLDDAFARAEAPLVTADAVLRALVRNAEALGLKSASEAAAKAAAAAKLAKTNIAFAPPSSLKILSSEPAAIAPPASSWFSSSSLPPSPAAAAQPAPGHTLFLLFRTMANLCGCNGNGGNIPRKAVMQAGAAPFLVAALIPNADARVWSCGGGVLRVQPMVGLEDVAGNWANGVREEAVGTLSNLVFAPQARSALIKACVLDVMEEVGYWTSADGSLVASARRSSSSTTTTTTTSSSASSSSSSSTSGARGARLLHETSAFVERCASVVKSLSQDDACRKRMRGSSKLQELNALAPRQLQDYRFFRARADDRDCVYWGGNLDVYAGPLPMCITE